LSDQTAGESGSRGGLGSGFGTEGGWRQQEHQDALVASSYFERRWVWIPDSSLDARDWKKLCPELTNTVIAKTPYTMTFNGRRPHELEITARKDEIDEFERTLHTRGSR
jgi:hypothetical protein